MSSIITFSAVLPFSDGPYLVYQIYHQITQTTLRLTTSAQTYSVRLPVGTTDIQVSGGNAEILTYTTTD